MNPALALNACLLAVAFCAAACVRDEGERFAAMVCTAGLFPIWAIYTCAFIPAYNPAHLFPDSVRSGHIWTTLDLFGGLLAVIVARRFWWSRLLWATFLFETIVHSLRWKHHVIAGAGYYRLLDGAFYAQLALFILLGGGGLARRISDCLVAGRAFLPVRGRMAASQALMCRVQ